MGKLEGKRHLINKISWYKKEKKTTKCNTKYGFLNSKKLMKFRD